MIVFEPIGLIRTPYQSSAPRQPVVEDRGEFRLELHSCYRPGLAGLETFRYIHVLFYLDRLDRPVSMQVTPPWADGRQVGLFASRSPARPNPIGLSVVGLKKIAGTSLYISGIDVFDGTPLLDIKPYIPDHDRKSDANRGWLDEVHS